ncbi:MAG: hypothetical protein ACJAV6_000290 [Candidatus Paceibacteria bacterium]|jgi:hypothetical protein
MNDPLRDNRIFPEEMHDVIQQKEPIHHTYFWQWFAFGAIFILVILWFAFGYHQDNTSSPVQSDEDTLYEQQVSVFEALQNSRPPMTPTQREDKINALFGNQ